MVDRSAQIKLPSDLGGATPVTFDSRRRDGNLLAAVSEAAETIKEAAKRLGSRSSGAGGKADRVFSEYSNIVSYSPSLVPGYLAATFQSHRQVRALKPIRAWVWTLTRASDKEPSFSAGLAPTKTVTRCSRSGDGRCVDRGFHKTAGQLSFRIDFEPELRPGEEFLLEYELKIEVHRPATLSALRALPKSLVPTLGEATYTSIDINYPIEMLELSVVLPLSLGTSGHHFEVVRGQLHDQEEAEAIERTEAFDVSLVHLEKGPAWSLNMKRQNPPVGVTYRFCWTPPNGLELG